MNGDPFQIQIELHPETHLLQTLRLGPQRSVQILELFGKYYLLERYKGERRPPVQLEEADLISRLAREDRLLADEIEPLLPPLRGFDIVLDDEEKPAPLSFSASADPLQSKLQNAMARFAAQNPDTAEALQWSQALPARAPASPARTTSLPQAESAYGAHPALGGGPAGSPAPALEPLPSTVRESRPIESFTQPLVQQALQQATDNQQKLLEQAQQLKQEVDKRSDKVQRSLDRLPAFQERFDALNQQLEQWQSEMEKHHFSRDSLLERTDEELASLQRQLRQILSEGLALQKVLREHRFPEHSQMLAKLECFEDMLDHVVQQRHWVHYLQQQQAFGALERERLKLLQQRQQELLAQITRLKDAIQHIEQINREILARDPLAVPEPVPALALHELSRLEYELQMLESDPALQLLEENE
ncbi:MAG TPA: hypothetical protein V6D23_00760 [Candidatus Obscuribacterales bacterium]